MKTSFIFCLLLFGTIVQAQEFHTYCNTNQPCNSGKFLKCFNQLCECEDSENQIYDAIEGQCVIVAGKPCVPDLSPEVALCVQGAECNSDKNICECSPGFYETELNICSYTIGKACKGPSECDMAQQLTCQNGVCRCQNSSFVWQLEHGCISSTELDLLDNSTKPEVSTTTISPSSIIFINSEVPPQIKPIVDNSLEQNQNGTIDQDEELMETTTTQFDQDGDRIGIPSSTSRYPIVNLVNKFVPPLLNPLNPNHPLRPAKPTFIPPSQFDSPPPPNKAFNPEQGQSSPASPTTEDTFNPVEFPNFAHPITRPLRPSDLLGIRRYTNPIKRFLFPRLFAPDPHKKDGDLEFPSPIWVAVTSINRILPVLRVMDYQLSPVLQNLAALTRPRYLDQLVHQHKTYLGGGQGQSQGQRIQQLGRTDYFTEVRPLKSLLFPYSRRNKA